MEIAFPCALSYARGGGSMKRKHEKSDVRREQIAEAVLDILCVEGMGGLTATKVAKAVGLVPSALYRHYSGKLEMLEAGVELLGERVGTRLEQCAAGDDDPLAALRRMLDALTGMLHEMQVVPRVLFSDETMTGHAEYKGVIFKLQQRVLGTALRHIATAQRLGMVRNDIPPDRLAIAYIGMFVPLAVLYHSTGGGIDLQSHLDANWQFFLDGAAPERAGER